MFLLLACAPYPEGLRATPAGDGPMIRVDWDHKPLADVPFPSDLATRPDPTSPTGLRLNISLDANTHEESEARAKLNELSGFGLYSPISVGFEAPLDLDVIAARHVLDTRPGRSAMDDDVLYLIDVDPDSPAYGTAAELDLGQGHFPMDAVRSDRYFANDTRSASPSILFDTIDEDLDGDGLLDRGEDTDFDGILDVANVYPAGGDARANLLTWYERASDTLIARPVVPLREETTYAVVLTNRIVGEDGSPIRSPWEYVSHLRQTEALAPLAEVLPGLGLTLDDVAFTWAFTTGRVTRDLVDIHDGLYGSGPFASLGATYPSGVNEAAQVHNIPGVSDTWQLDPDLLIGTLSALGFFEGESAEVISAAYSEYAGAVVGGAFTTPYLLADRDDGGEDDSDEWWQIDGMAGTLAAEPQRVVFSCVLPKETGPGTPVALFGHGYGSSRFDFLGFSWAFVKEGWVSCAIDFPGHGPTVSAEEEELVAAVLGNTGLLPFYDHLKDARFRDLDNDGVKDSGGDQWTADAFHTRDIVRQAVVDWMQMVRTFEGCGTGTMLLPDGTEATACDWDGDGAADFGGEGGRYSIIGGSLGGIDAAVAAAVMPEVESFVPIVPGGGLMDIGVRTEIGGAVEAMVGRLITPMFLGYPQPTGELILTQMVNSATEMREYTVATLPSIPVGGRVEVENLDNGIVREGILPADGTFRIAIPADGLEPAEKRLATGMPMPPIAGAVYEVPDNDGLGDRLVVRLYDASETLVATIDTFAADIVHEGVTMRAGSPLVALSHGNGHIRATPDVRRVASVFSAVLEPGDPIAYAPRYVLDPLFDRPANVLLMPVPGDPIVNINTGIALARAAGVIDRDHVDPRYGMSVDQYLIDRRVVQGLEEHGPYLDANGLPCLFDADDLDNGTDGTGAPSDQALRAQVHTDTGITALRLPYVRTTGQHGFGLPEPSLPFDINTFSISQVGLYVSSGGTVLSDDPCLEDDSCPGGQ